MICPIIVGVSQFTQHKRTKEPLDPLSLMVKTGNEAILNTGVREIAALIDAIYMVNINSWSYNNAPKELATRLKLSPEDFTYLSDGGNTPQMLVNRACNAIQEKKYRVILITGAEALYSKLNNEIYIKKNWPKYEPPKEMEGEIWDGINAFENNYGLKYPPYTYAIFETALRAFKNRSLDSHRKYMGKLFEHFSEIASENPYSWTKKRFGFKEIINTNNDNRLITHPYTKRMCANLYVDQSASILITSEDIAQNINLNRKLWVNIIGGTDLNNIHETTQRPRLYDSPALKKAAKLALNQARLSLDQIDGFDIYSCFPSIVQIIMNELGIPLDDERNLTLTGGLPYFGGPWSNYSLHSIVNAVNSIRKNPSLRLMVIANGGYNTKQSIGIYGKFGPKISWDDVKTIELEVQKKIYSTKLRKPIERANGEITIRGYTITFDRSGNPKKGIILGEFKNGTRTLAFMNFSIKRLLKLENEELVGRKAKVAYDEEIDRNIVISIEERSH